MKLASAEWRSLSALLDEALALPEADRISWVGTLGAEHEPFKALLREVLDRPALVETADLLGTLPAFSLPSASEWEPGATVGPYRLVREVGRGGMGAVWLAERMDGLVLPGGPLGVTPLHMPFEGTITLSSETYIRLVVETCASTAQHGAKYCLLLNWHELNIPPLGVAAETLHREHGMTVLTVQACFVAEDLYGPECNGLTHGGEIETLAVLAHDPKLVHLDRIDYSSDHQHGRKIDALRRTRTYQPVLTDVRSIAPTGWYGSPQHATEAKSVRVINGIADKIARDAAEIFRQLDAIQGGGVAELREVSAR